MATISDIARKTGYSVMTVSRVINNSPNVASGTKESITKAVQDLKYSPNASARRLVKRRSQTIGLIIGYDRMFSSYYFLTIMKGIEEKLETTDYSMIMYASASSNLKSEKKLLNLVKQKFVDGFITVAPVKNAPYMEMLYQNSIPTVAVGTNFPSFDCVDIDNYNATQTAVEYLINKGHRKIGLIKGSESRYDAIEREIAFNDCLKKHNLPINRKWFIDGEFEYRQAHLNTLKLINKGDLPTAFFSSSDLMAIGALDAMTYRNIKIPKQVSIISIDDLDLSASLKPPLTTMKQPLFDMGEIAAARLIELIENGKGNLTKQNTTVKAKLIERKSVRNLL